MPRNKKKQATKRSGRVRSRGPKEKSNRTRAAKPAKAPIRADNSAGSNRAEGIRLFKLAGRPTKEQFQLVYGDRGHLLTWKQRTAAGVPAEKFQAALAAKQKAR